MATSKMVKMGIKRKDMHGGDMVASPKEYDKETVRPELHLDGPHAEMMGAEDLKVGDRVRQTVEWEVKSVGSTTKDGKTSHSLTLCLDKGGDMEDCGDVADDEDAADKGADEGDESGNSPAMAYIQGKAAKE